MSDEGLLSTLLGPASNIASQFGLSLPPEVKGRTLKLKVSMDEFKGIITKGSKPEVANYMRVYIADKNGNEIPDAILVLELKL
ncbi:MAG: hypothetical protein ACP5L5_11395 [Vulcanisaeta sp.]|uniref:hypothetical protein n=1 Tax=Vulcanisaeta sp. TaxID=2020871 RepID=UPI003D136F64